ncbi:MAG: hypothetical protein O7G87_22430 [bacterium]|nr:hypothetical protein [bacterium]
MYLVWVLIAVGMVWAEEDIPITIPEQNRSKVIIFSHQFHLQDIGLECTDCHVNAPQSERSGDNLLPKEANCSDCHGDEVKDPDQCQKCHQDVAHPVAFENPERVIDFPHEFHLARVGLQCEDCHRGMMQTDYAARKHWPAMPDCLTCHQDEAAPADCETCHPKVEVIRPQTHQQNWIHEHRQFSRAGDMPCAMCHQDSWCEDCHAGALLVSLEGPAEKMASGAPANRGRVGQIVQRQHELNYRFTHPMDAVGKERACATCHDQTFCVDCHRVEGQERRFKPVWHGPLLSDPRPWVLGGVGSGGGRHAEWARRDMEQCVACHDVEGDDPSCIQCHVDFDGVRGTDPQTHPRRFASHIGEGDFHDNPHSLCYACHVDTRISGTGFCGYCHR